MTDFELSEQRGWGVYGQNPYTGKWRLDGAARSEMMAYTYAGESQRVEEVVIRPVCLGADPVQWAAVMLAFGLLSALANLDKPGWWTHLRDAMPSFGGSLEREP